MGQRRIDIRRTREMGAMDRKRGISSIPVSGRRINGHREKRNAGERIEFRTHAHQSGQCHGGNAWGRPNGQKRDLGLSIQVLMDEVCVVFHGCKGM